MNETFTLDEKHDGMSTMVMQTEDGQALQICPIARARANPDGEMTVKMTRAPIRIGVSRLSYF